MLLRSASKINWVPPLLSALARVQDDLPIGQSRWIIVNPDHVALFAACGRIQSALPRAQVVAVDETFREWLHNNATQLQACGALTLDRSIEPTHNEHPVIAVGSCRTLRVCFPEPSPSALDRRQLRFFGSGRSDRKRRLPLHQVATDRCGTENRSLTITRLWDCGGSIGAIRHLRWVSLRFSVSGRSFFCKAVVQTRQETADRLRVGSIFPVFSSMA